MTLQLPVVQSQDIINIQSIFNDALRDELLNRENWLKDPHDGFPYPTVRKTDFAVGPSHLVIQLVRFRVDALGCQSKVDTEISLIEDIRTGNDVYCFVSAIIHLGTIANGHYVFAVKTNDSYYLFDDSTRITVCKARFYQLCNQAYILAYEKA